MSDAAPAADVLERQNSVAPPQEEAPAAPPSTPAQPAPSLTLADLQGMVRVITAACERGTFRPTELSSVGQLHDRLVAYLKSQSQ